MSKLRLRVDKYLDGDGTDSPQALANIYSLDVATRGRSSSPTARQEMIPISHEASKARTVDIAPGRYRVEVVLPSGEILTDDVRAAKGQESEVVLKGRESPHEWLGWQFLAGNVAASSAWTRPELRTVIGNAIKASRLAATSKAATGARGSVPKKRIAARKKQASSIRSAAKGINPFSGEELMFKALPTGRLAARPFVRSGVGDDRALAAGAASAAPATKIDDPIFWLSSPWAQLLSDAWLQLGELSTHVPTIEVLNSGKVPFPISSAVSDPMRAVFRVMHGSGGSRQAIGLNSALARDFVVVRNDSSVELLSLPTPWVVPRSGREAVIEIVVQRVMRPYEFSSSITVHDEHLAMLLGYLSAGSITNAAAIAGHATGLLFGKVRNPLAAAAGAYALIGSETDSKPKQWHAWVTNLMNWNPHLADGAIQFATLKMRRGPSQSAEACKLFKQACRRGLPHYSLGLRWLLDGLERFSSRDPESARLAQQVRAVSSRMHQQSPFTIIRLGSR